MDWFERLTGFREQGYAETRARLAVENGRLRSLATGASYGIGTLDLASLDDLRARVRAGGGPAGRMRVQAVAGDVREMHRDPAHAGALFQVASQFNLLEMTCEDVTPEHGVTRYQSDPTQGPACAIAAGAATIYRNYFAPTGGGEGQTADRQIDALAGLGAALGTALGMPVDALWAMRNGYALCSGDGLDAIARHLRALDAPALDRLRGELCIGVHSDVEVTEAEAPRPLVSQAFCSALPVSYGEPPRRRWAAFATLVLEAAYEATLWAAVLNARRGASNVVLLTRLGGGAFGNDEAWIDAAMLRALSLAADYDLDVRLVGRDPSAPALARIERAFR